MPSTKFFHTEEKQVPPIKLHIITSQMTLNPNVHYVQTSIHCLFIIINMTISLSSNINEIFLKPMKDTIFNYCK